MKKIAVVPIDNRPICYNLIGDILAQDNDIELFLPEREFLGSLKQNANIEEIFNFLQNLPKVDILVLSLDTIAYGGLVSSRRCCEDFEEIKTRVEKLKKIIKNKADKILAFSSIMRISNNNINEEEKLYWSDWGEKIFKYSWETHKNNIPAETDVPQEILEDYLNTRKRNFEINRIYLDWLSDKTLDTLVFSKDDTGEFGLNVQEANLLAKEAQERNLPAIIKTGADEIPLTLLARGLCKDKNIKIQPQYVFKESINLISKYEDISLKNCVEGQIELAGCKISNMPDLIFYINNFSKAQGDLVLGDVINSSNFEHQLPQKPYFIADVNNANGADNDFVEQILKEKTDNIFSYCGYNTSANSIGCAILSAVVNFLAKKQNTFDKNGFKKLMFIRLLDDWAYQADTRKDVRENGGEFYETLKKHIKDFEIYENKIANFLDFKYNEVNYTLPWDRSFEVEINVENI